MRKKAHVATDNKCIYLLKKSTGVGAGQVYVGLTNHYHRRMQAHKRTKTIPCGGVSRQITPYLPPSVAQEMERDIIERYESDASRECLNKRAGGGLGAAAFKSDEYLIDVASRYSRRVDFQRDRKSDYMSVLNRGLEVAMAHMPPPRKKKTIREITMSAYRYKNRVEFKAADGASYEAARKLGMLDHVCGHMGSVQRWTRENILRESRKHVARSEFAKANIGAYQAAMRTGVFEEAVAHMPIRAKYAKDSAEGKGDWDERAKVTYV